MFHFSSFKQRPTICRLENLVDEWHGHRCSTHSLFIFFLISMQHSGHCQQDLLILLCISLLITKIMFKLKNQANIDALGFIIIFIELIGWSHFLFDILVVAKWALKTFTFETLIFFRESRALTRAFKDTTSFYISFIP